VPLLDTLLAVARLGQRLRSGSHVEPDASPPTEGEPVFISADASVTRGSAAAELIASKNDEAYASPEGIVRVDRARWQEAQRYEETTWMVRGRAATDDRNLQHLERFDEFQALEGRRFRSAIEVGCGPFTNLRLILPRVTVDEIDLLDPLIERYLTHPNCTYRSLTLGGKPVRTFASALEDFQPDRTYDLVVMINVIEHCFDATVAFAKVLDLLEPDGVFVFQDKLYAAESIEPGRVYDAGHPLRVRGEIIDAFLRDSFASIFEHRVDASETELPMLYFIGARR
jgi:SAM-dependent methyltransferase